jgi:hypothetical protein
MRVTVTVRGVSTSLNALVMAVALTGCAGQLSGVPRVMDTAGVVQSSPPRAQDIDLRSRFKDSVDTAVRMNTPGDVAIMVRRGNLLARANCDDFFTDAALLQRRTNLAHDTIAPVLGVITAVLALRGVSNSDNTLKILSIGSTAALAGISLIDQHFLFGAENIKEVRDLTFQALDVHAAAIEALAPQTFDAGVQQIIDHQVICTPASILGLTKQAIAAGRVEAETRTSKTHDKQALADLGDELGLTGPATPEQAAALWMLYETGASSSDVPQDVEDKIKAANLSQLLEPSVAATPATGDKPATDKKPAKLSAEGTSKKARILSILETFSDGTKARLAKAAGDAKNPFYVLNNETLIAPESEPTSVKLIVR